MWWTPAHAETPIPAETTQLVLVEAPDPDGSEATVSRWTRAGASDWTLVGAPVPARIGAHGVAWGRGLHPPQPGLQKVEGDQRAPAGVFRLGDAWGDAPTSPARWPYHPVGPRDLWYEDPASPLYNTHVQVPGTAPLTPEQRRAVMRSGDPAHALKVFVAHNAPPDAVPGAGSAIFLHTWRKDGVAPTAGCTAMDRADLDVLVGWLDPASHPVVVVLATRDLELLDDAWGLPTPPR